LNTSAIDAKTSSTGAAYEKSMQTLQIQNSEFRILKPGAISANPATS
jgi:hypothetical protein